MYDGFVQHKSMICVPISAGPNLSAPRHNIRPRNDRWKSDGACIGRESAIDRGPQRHRSGFSCVRGLRMDLPPLGSQRLQKRVRCSSLDGFLGEQHVSQTKGVDWMSLSSSSSMQMYQEGDTVIREGEKYACIFVLTEGKASVMRNGSLLASLAEGEIFGEGYLLGQASSASVVVTSDRAVVVQLNIGEDERELMTEDQQYVNGLASPPGSTSSSPYGSLTTTPRGSSATTVSDWGPFDSPVRSSSSRPSPSPFDSPSRGTMSRAIPVALTKVVREQSLNSPDLHSFVHQMSSTITSPRLPRGPRTPQLGRSVKHAALARRPSPPPMASEPLPAHVLADNALRRQRLFFCLAEKLAVRLQKSTEASKKKEAKAPVPLKAPPSMEDLLLATEDDEGGAKKRDGTVTKLMKKARLGHKRSVSMDLKKAKQKQDDAFSKRFRLPKTETVLAEWQVEWQTGQNGMAGRIFLSENYLCFYGQGFAFRTKTVTPVSQVSSWGMHSDGRLRVVVKGSDDDLWYRFIKPEDSVAARPLLKEHLTSSMLMNAHPRSLKRKETWVLQHQLDEAAMQSFNFQDCLLLLHCSTRKVFKHGEKIIDAQSTEPLYVGMWKVATGRVKVQHADGSVLAVLGKNSFFGEISFLLHRTTATASIIALDPVVEVLFLDGELLQTFFDQYSNFAARFYKYLSTIIASRFRRYNLLFCTKTSFQILRQGNCLVAMEGESKPTPAWIHLTLHRITLTFHEEGDVTIKLAEMTNLRMDDLALGFSVETTSGQLIKIVLSNKNLQDLWLLAIDGTCTKSYDMHFLTNEARSEMAMRVACGESDCEISRHDPSGEEEAWIFQYGRNAVIPLSINRTVECTWDGLKFRAVEAGKKLPLRGNWNGIEAIWNNGLVSAAAGHLQGERRFVWFDPVRTFQTEIGDEAYTFHHTKVRKEHPDGSTSFQNAVKFRNRLSEKTFWTADPETPAPLLLFLGLTVGEVLGA